MVGFKMKEARRSLRVCRPLAHLLGPPFLPPLRPFSPKIFPNSNFRIPPIDAICCEGIARFQRRGLIGPSYTRWVCCAPCPQTRRV